jgi:hypothetical protein
MTLLAVTILGLKIAGRELAIGGVVAVAIVGAIAWVIYTRRAK